MRQGAKVYSGDHNATGMTLWFACGGVKVGQIVGATDETGRKAVEVVHPYKDVYVTLLRLLGLDDARLTCFHADAPSDCSGSPRLVGT